MTPLAKPVDLAAGVARRLLDRNPVCEEFFSREAPRLAEVCRAMSERFLRGGRLLAFGRGPYSTDAQHVSVEFVHPVIVGKRALPALDLSAASGPWLQALLRPEDIVMGFGPPEGDPEVSARTASRARRRRPDPGAARRRGRLLLPARRPGPVRPSGSRSRCCTTRCGRPCTYSWSAARRGSIRATPAFSTRFSAGKSRTPAI